MLGFWLPLQFTSVAVLEAGWRGSAEAYGCYWLWLETLVRGIEGREKEKEQEGKQGKEKDIVERESEMRERGKGRDRRD